MREVAVQLLRSLGFLYQQNIIHGDLKPENILLSKGKIYVVGAFGFISNSPCSHFIRLLINLASDFHC